MFLRQILLTYVIVCTNKQESKTNSWYVSPEMLKHATHSGIKGWHLRAQPTTVIKIKCNLFRTSNFLLLFSNLKQLPRTCFHKSHRTTLLYLCILLLSRSSDIQTNPGPDISQCVDHDSSTRYLVVLQSGSDVVKYHVPRV